MALAKINNVLRKVGLVLVIGYTPIEQGGKDFELWVETWRHYQARAE